ncbi:serine/arginine repetitive matrix protein 1-like isoform X2 [Rana temporaria]|uniref:serine/arginine repetitive matrix protein 1-like isoform X2 n=1 Tax=Rana temporaria TaxID=8407 RepID=UPI001AAD8794|nr:serine/arginine repetitive matrix protein 1-like isoform X2 [Rana temporaria]
MRTLLILGGLVCVLLVTPSHGDRTESRDGGEKGTSDLREFFGQNEDGKANGIGSFSAIDQLRFRRQEPSSPGAPQRRKKCPGCFSAIASVDVKPISDPIRFEVYKRSRRQEKKQEPSSPSNPPKRKKCPGCFSSLSVDDPIKLSKRRSRRQEKKQEPSSPGAPQRRKKCPGCFSSLIVTDPIKLSKRARRQEKKNKKRKSKPSINPPLPMPNMYTLAARSTRTSRDTKPKRSKKLRVSGPDGLERKTKSDRPSRRKLKESEEPRSNMFSLMSVPPSDFGKPEKTPKDEGRRERKKNGRKHGREEQEERKLRKHPHSHHSHHRHHPHHHHPHPHPEKEGKKRGRTGSRSAITSTDGERKELSDGKEASERMKRQSKKGNRRKEKKEGWTVGSRSPIASLPG